MRLRRSAADRGATLVEYAVLVALIVVPVVPALAFLEGGLGSSFETQAAAMSSDAPSSPTSTTSSTTTTSTTTSTTSTTTSTTTTSTTTTTAPNQPPTADFEFTCDRLECSFTDRSHDDRGIAIRVWNIGGTTTAAPAPTHTFAGPGTHAVQLTVTDTDQVSAAVTKQVDIPAVKVSLVGSSSQTGSSGKRSYVVTVSAADSTGQPSAGVIITGSWSDGGGTAACQTTDGSCRMVLDLDKGAAAGARTFTTTAINHWAWDGTLPAPLSIPQPTK